MDFYKNTQTIANSGVSTHCIEENQKSIIKADTKTHSLSLATGEVISYKMLNGIILHGGCTTELQDYQITSTLSKSIIIVILLDGELTFNYDDLDIQLNSVDEHASIIVNFCKPVCFGREFKKGNKVTKLNISLPTSWVDSFIANDTDLQHVIEKHLTSSPLMVTATMKAKAQEIIELNASHTLIDKMKIESHTQSLLMEIFEQLSVQQKKLKKSERKTTQNVSSDYALDDLIKYIEVNIDKNLTPASLSEVAAMSVSNIQRRFKKSLGYSIQSYIRRRRLDLARQKIERGLIGITEAAYSCGYRYPSNFTNAYKKAFGYPPAMTVKK